MSGRRHQNSYRGFEEDGDYQMLRDPEGKTSKSYASWRMGNIKCVYFSSSWCFRRLYCSKYRLWMMQVAACWCQTGEWEKLWLQYSLYWCWLWWQGWETSRKTTVPESQLWFEHFKNNKNTSSFMSTNKANASKLIFRQKIQWTINQWISSHHKHSLHFILAN